ncbi:SipW-dependent-type signal peptide-containing protein [Virgibacillus sp. NKC19-16]|uniref:TasA family protein n=1 Tax=Virgibacillus salidurans TaxID=2831673 RepID=UPI001F1C36C5|nr:TasA family protein [Virgibacillus sp. NKC19-16]UJL45362.1 SipW-dependent-type signal peptide-containing protein [Virgibacillus sp. NKC19-16]
MNIKNRIMLCVATAVLGLGLIGGGTYAYFNDTEPTQKTFATGVLDLGLNKETIIDIKDIIPGDTVDGKFELTNDGTVGMSEVILHSSYDVVDNNKSNDGDDLGDHIRVEFLDRTKEEGAVISEVLLSELTDNPVKVLDEFPADSKPEQFSVQFKFVDNDGSQNHFQGDELKLTWEFVAEQREGRSNSN